MNNILEKYRDAVEEYAACMQKQMVELLKDVNLTQNEIDNYNLEYKTHMMKSLESNEAYAQLSLDLMHCEILEKNLYSLTHIAKGINSDNPSYVIQSWLRNRNTLELLRCWELEYNKDLFDDQVALSLIEKTREPSFTITAKIWCEKTKAKGIISKQGKNGGTYAYQEIAVDFLTWASPVHRYKLPKMIIAKSLALEAIYEKDIKNE